MKQLESQPFQSKLNLNSEEFENNKSSMLEMISELNELLDEAEAGGGPDHHKRLAARENFQFEKEFSTSWTQIVLFRN